MRQVPALSRALGQRLFFTISFLLLALSSVPLATAGELASVTVDSSISTVAGNGSSSYDPQQDGGPATSASLSLPRGIAVDAAGNVYIADLGNSRIRKVDTSGTITTVAGGGEGCETQTDDVGDGCQATEAILSGPENVIMDAAGNLYIADTDNSRVRKVDAETHVITTIAGTGDFEDSGDDGPATEAALAAPYGLAFDADGNLYISGLDYCHIRRVNREGTITTIAGTGECGFSGDGGAATQAEVDEPAGLTFDSAGNLYVADLGNQRVRKIDTEGTITTVAGTGELFFNQDGLQATSTNIGFPFTVVFDQAGNRYVNTLIGNRVLKIDSSGISTTIAGSGSGAFSGDGGPATLAGISGPVGLAFDATGNLYISSQSDGRVRKVIFTATTLPRTSVGEQSAPQNVGLRIHRSLALASIAISEGYNDFSIGQISGCTVDGETLNSDGTLCVVPVTFSPKAPGKRSAPLVVTDSNGRIYSFGLTGFGDGPVFTFIPGLIETAKRNLTGPSGVASDGAGNVYLADTGNHVVWRMKADGTSSSTVAGNTELGGTYQGDGGPATSAGLNHPSGLAVDAAGNLYIADRDNNVIRKVDIAGMITTIAGNGNAGGDNCDDGGPATSGELNAPTDVAVDSQGNLYIADNGNQAIRQVDVNGNLTTVAGQLGTSGYGGDAGPATAATFNSPTSVAIDGSDNLYITDAGNAIVRKIAHSAGIITTVAGTPQSSGNSGDGGPAISAQLAAPVGVAVDAEGSLYIADNSTQVVRKVDASGNISTIAGTAGSSGSSGDGGVATAAELSAPTAVDVDGFGNLFIADKDNGRLRRVDAGETALAFGNVNLGESSDPQTVTVHNAGTADLQVSDFSISNGFALTGGSCNLQTAFPAGATCTAEVTFTPTAAGAANGSANITSNSANSPQVALLSGTGIAVIAPTTTTLTVNPQTQAMAGQSVTLTATVSAQQGTPSGTVTFFDGQTSLGPGTVTNGTATLQTTTLALGSHTLTARYGGDSNFSRSTSSAVSLSAVAAPTPDYSLTANPLSVTIQRGRSAQVTITLTPINGFTGTVNLSCGTLPVGVTCTFNPASLTSNGTSPVSTTLTVTTTGTQLTGVRSVLPMGGTLALLAPFAFGAALVGRNRRRGKYAAIGTLLFLFILIVGMAACGSSHPSTPNSGATPIGQQSVAINTSAGSGGGAIQHSIQLTINITN